MTEKAIMRTDGGSSECLGSMKDKTPGGEGGFPTSSACSGIRFVDHPVRVQNGRSPLHTESWGGNQESIAELTKGKVAVGGSSSSRLCQGVRICR